MGTMGRGQVCSDDLRCDHCKSWSVDRWSVVQAYIDELQERHEEERKVLSKSSSLYFSGFDPNDRPIPISEFNFLLRLHANSYLQPPWTIGMWLLQR